jgi:hypothetical protein
MPSHFLLEFIKLCLKMMCEMWLKYYKMFLGELSINRKFSLLSFAVVAILLVLQVGRLEIKTMMLRIHAALGFLF